MVGTDSRCEDKILRLSGYKQNFSHFNWDVLPMEEILRWNIEPVGDDLAADQRTKHYSGWDVFNR